MAYHMKGAGSLALYNYYAEWNECMILAVAACMKVQKGQPIPNLGENIPVPVVNGAYVSLCSQIGG